MLAVHFALNQDKQIENVIIGKLVSMLEVLKITGTNKGSRGRKTNLLCRDTAISSGSEYSQYN